jgi:hypothetical protein
MMQIDEDLTDYVAVFNVLRSLGDFKDTDGEDFAVIFPYFSLRAWMPYAGSGKDLPRSRLARLIHASSARSCRRRTNGSRP